MADKELILKADCIVCHYKINFRADRFVRLTDFNGKKQESECFYHLDCWKNKFKIQRDKALGFIKPALRDMADKLAGVKNEQEYIVQ